MATAYYLAAFIFSYGLAVASLIIWNKKSYSYFVNMFWLIAVSNGGYYILATARSLETAILAKKLCYIGGCFLPMLIFFNITSLCKVKVNKIISTLLTIFCAGAFGCVLTIGVSDIFYISCETNTINGVTVLEKVNGPTYYLYLVSLLGLNIASIVVAIRSLRNKYRHTISFINTWLLAITFVWSSLVYIIQRVMHSYIDWMPLTYTMCIVVFFIVYRRVEKYDINSLVVHSYEKENVHGYVIVNKKGKYLGSNDMAKSYYPNLKELKIDYKLDNKDMLFNRINKEMKNISENSSIMWHQTVGDKDLKFEMSYNYYNDKHNGYLIEIIDDTLQQQYIKLINNYNNELETAVKIKTDSIQEIQNKIIVGIANVIESRDNSTGGHIKRTSDVVRIFVEKLRENNDRLNKSENFYNNLVKAAPMHDIGKIAIDDVVLKKPGKYMPEEYEVMKTHSGEGARIIDRVLEGVEDESFVEIARNVANYHHEKYDGNGYPNKLKGEEIPLEARIMAFADVFDALVSKRCYKEKMGYTEAFEIIKESCGNQFDPLLGEIFLQCKDELKAYYDGIEED